MNLYTVYDGCSAKEEETLLQNDLQTYLNTISFPTRLMKLGSITFAENWQCILTKSLTNTLIIIFACGLKYYRRINFKVQPEHL